MIKLVYFIGVDLILGMLDAISKPQNGMFI